MSQEWLKIEKATLEKPETFRMAFHLKIDRDLVIGKLLRLWAYFDTHTVDGELKDTSKAFIDDLVSLPGFSDAMILVGWLVKKKGSFVLPNFHRHNGVTAKKRALSSLRTARHRSVTEVAEDVTHEALQERYTSVTRAPRARVTRIEKNRVEENREEKEKESFQKNESAIQLLAQKAAFMSGKGGKASAISEWHAVISDLAGIGVPLADIEKDIDASKGSAGTRKSEPPWEFKKRLMPSVEQKQRVLTAEEMRAL